MRRNEKEIGERAGVDEIIHHCQVCHLGLCLGHEPYVVPVNFGYDGEQLYFHTAIEGKKTDILARNSRVCFQMERNATLVARSPEPCSWSFAFESVIGFGRARELLLPEEKKYGLMQIIQHYGEQAAPPAEKKLAAVRVWTVSIDEVTGKRSMP
ncbi:MAG: pyridoxamine 5'-phosphate oxidase family protein [Desulfosarcinaceae bacterium]